MELRFDAEVNAVSIRLTGPLDKENILGALEACVSDTRYRSGIGRRRDFLEADLSSLDSETVRDMAQYSLKFPPGVRDVKVAFLTNRPLEYGLSRMFEMSSNAETPIRVFREMESALSWMAD
jgi:hypothetical protein